ncbi:hypothetical protein OMCYN_01655 [cyanobiont of Ornithocercus magnificus]|nr:hypothetical protein OMCYN_01655 [cyanobiont of Ornithocercus magnificus]
METNEAAEDLPPEIAALPADTQEVFRYAQKAAAAEAAAAAEIPTDESESGSPPADENDFTDDESTAYETSFDAVDPEHREILLDAQDEFSTYGTITQETLEKLHSLPSEALVQAQLEFMRGEQPEYAEQPGDQRELSREDSQRIIDSVGGQDDYTQMKTWAEQQLDPQSIDAFNNALQRQDAAEIQLAVAGLYSMYQDACGRDGRLISGKTATQSYDVYKNPREFLDSLPDPGNSTSNVFDSGEIDFQKIERTLASDPNFFNF